MGVYNFMDEIKGIRVNRHDLPSPWINYLSNGRMHAFVSQAGGGFAWWMNPIHYRITRYRMYNLPIDSPGFYVYIREKDGSCWSPSYRPCGVSADEWFAVHQPGMTTFSAARNNLKTTFTLFVTPDYDTLAWELHFTNLSRESMTFDVFAYVELSQLAWKDEIFSGYYWRHMLKTWWDKDTGSLLYLHHYQFHPEIDMVPLVYFASSKPVASFSGSRDSFIGPYRDERAPLGVEAGNCGNSGLSTGEPCAALQNVVSLGPGETTGINYFLGVIPGAMQDFNKAKEKLANELEQLRTADCTVKQKEKLGMWWAEHLGAMKCEIPDRDAQRQINIWSPVNSVNTFRYSRSVNANAPGVRGYGFRDSCQDAMAVAYRKPDWAKERLAFLLSYQYEDGHAVHTIPFSKKEAPDENIHCDNHLWLPMLVHFILSETGDLSLLEMKVPFLRKDGMSWTKPATVREHMLAAVRFTEEHLGKHGLPLTLKGDWNDIIGRYSVKGLGESVFAGQQYVLVLRMLCDIFKAAGNQGDGSWDDGCHCDEYRDDGHRDDGCHYDGYQDDVKWLEDCLKRQQQAILDCGWDGKWWLRGFDDDGNPIGSEKCEFGKVFLNPQSWAVLGNIGTLEQQRQAMDAVYEHLVTGAGLKLLAPGFKTWPEVSNPFTGYGPGCGENGAIFCHANTWAIIAEALLGNGTRAWEYFTRLVPHLALQRMGLEKYKSEPYAWVSNIVGPENPQFGWANVNHVTGTAAWMDIAATQYLLGVRPSINGLVVNPCIPGEWKSFSVFIWFRGCMVKINVLNPEGVENGVRILSVDGNAVTPGDILPGGAIPGVAVSSRMLKGKSEVNIQVVMGRRD